MNKLTVIHLADLIPAEAGAYRYLERLHWWDTGPICPHCNETDM